MNVLCGFWKEFLFFVIMYLEAVVKMTKNFARDARNNRNNNLEVLCKLCAQVTKVGFGSKGQTPQQTVRSTNKEGSVGEIKHHNRC